MTLPRSMVALLALLASPVGGASAFYLIDIAYRIATDTMSLRHLRWTLSDAIFRTFPLTFLILTVGLVLVLTNHFAGYWDGRPPPKLRVCALLGALAGLLQAAVWSMAYYDVDDYIGEVDPGWLGAMLQEPVFVLVMTLPGIAAGATFWLVSYALSPQRAASD